MFTETSPGPSRAVVVIAEVPKNNRREIRPFTEPDCYIKCNDIF